MDFWVICVDRWPSPWVYTWSSPKTYNLRTASCGNSRLFQPLNEVIPDGFIKEISRNFNVAPYEANGFWVKVQDDLNPTQQNGCFTGWSMIHWNLNHSNPPPKKAAADFLAPLFGSFLPDEVHFYQKPSCGARQQIEEKRNESPLVVSNLYWCCA